MTRLIVTVPATGPAATWWMAFRQVSTDLITAGPDGTVRVRCDNADHAELLKRVMERRGFNPDHLHIEEA